MGSVIAEPPVIAYEFGPFRVDASERRLWRGGRARPLTPRLFDILLLLVRNHGQVVTKDTLMREIWPDCFVEENNLTVSISALRKALGERHGEREYIETVTKRGYRLVGRVREVCEGGEGEAGARPPRAGVAAGMVEQDGPALAVLPLANVGDDPNLEYLSDGVTESIINSLACLPRLRVMARSTVFRYKGREADVRQVGRELNVRSVVSGRLRRFNGRLLLSVELVNIEDGSQLWGERYNYPFSDIFQVQEEIAREITGKLRISLTGEDRERLSRRNTGNSDAYHFYLKGRYFWNKRTVEEINHGMQCFNEAARIAPDFAPAHLGLADCYLSLAVWNALPSNESLPLAKAEAARALEFDETLAEAHAALAYIEMLMLNWPAVDARFRRALELNPNCAQAHSRYSIYLAITGRFDEAAAEAERALAADPLSPVMHTNASRVFLYARRYERAAAHCREALEIEPRFAAARGILGVIHGATGRYDEAIGEMREVLAPAPDDPEALSILGYLHAALGRRAEARALLRRVRRLSRRTYVSAFFMGWIYAGLGEKDRAFECLERAYEERAYILSHLPVIFYYDCLRDDARFADLLRRIGLPNG